MAMLAERLRMSAKYLVSLAEVLSRDLWGGGKPSGHEQLVSAALNQTDAADEIERLKARETELLGAANKYLQEARDARLEARRLRLNVDLLLIRQDELVDERNALQAKLAEKPKLPRVRHYKGGTYTVDPVTVKMQISTGPVTGYENERLIRDGDELIVYRLEDGSMAFARFPDEFTPPRFEEIEP